MLRIEIKSEHVHVKTITAKQGVNAGKEFVIPEQAAYVHGIQDESGHSKAYPLEVRLSVKENAPYPVGVYEIGDGSFFVDRFGKLQVGRLQLVPVKAAQKVANA